MQLDVFCVGSEPDALDHLFDHGAHVHRLDAEPQRARQHAAHVEKVLNQLGLRTGIPFDGRQGAHLTIARNAVGLKHLHPAEDRVERGSQLVTDGRDELIFRTIRRGQLPVEVL